MRILTIMYFLFLAASVYGNSDCATEDVDSATMIALSDGKVAFKKGIKDRTFVSVETEA